MKELIRGRERGFGDRAPDRLLQGVQGSEGEPSELPVLPITH
jgi:hypothetical protein